VGVWHAMYWQTWAVFDLNSKISPQIHHLTKTSSVKCVPFYFLYSLLCSVWFHTGRPHSNSWQLAEELQFLQASDLCNALSHKSFLVHFYYIWNLEAGLVLLACLCTTASSCSCRVSAISFFFADSPGCQRPSCLLVFFPSGFLSLHQVPFLDLSFFLQM